VGILTILLRPPAEGDTCAPANLQDSGVALILS
jgi:hypothetical protein